MLDVVGSNSILNSTVKQKKKYLRTLIILNNGLFEFSCLSLHIKYLNFQIFVPLQLNINFFVYVWFCSDEN
jgi:hypothetical protein